MKYVSTLISVADMARSIAFYRDVLGLEVVADFGASVTLTGCVTLQTLDSWKGFIRTDDVRQGGNAWELYFEEADMDGFVSRLKQRDICCLHELFEHRWGQRVVRFYDPDRHIIEVGEGLGAVVARFMAGGMTLKQAAARMDIPADYAKSVLDELNKTGGAA